MDGSDHRTLHVWLTIMIGSVLFSSAAMFWQPSITGMVTSFDTGPEANFNPDFITKEQAYSQATTSAFTLLAMIAVQAGVYFSVTKVYA